MGRAKELRFKGKRNANGDPIEFLAAVPARDLDAAETAGLSDAEYADAIGTGLYEPAGAPPAAAKPADEGKEG